MPMVYIFTGAKLQRDEEEHYNQTPENITYFTGNDPPRHFLPQGMRPFISFQPTLVQKI